MSVTVCVGSVAKNIDVVRLITISKNRPRPGQRYRFGGGDKGIYRHDHGIAMADAQGHQGNVQGICAAGYPDAVPGLLQLCKTLLEFRNMFSKDKPGVR